MSKMTSGTSIYRDEETGDLVVLPHAEFSDVQAALHREYARHVAESMATASAVHRRMHNAFAEVQRLIANDLKRRTRK